MKQCSECLLAKPLDDFYPCRTNRDRRQGRCKQCYRDAANRRYAERGEEIRDHKRKRYQNDLDFREKHKADVLQWSRENPDSRAAYTRQWEVENQDKNRQKKRRNQASRHARKLDQFIENVDPAIVYEMHGGRCGICKQFIEGDFHVDHVIPLSKGGMHGYINVQPAHPVCNISKGNR